MLEFLKNFFVMKSQPEVYAKKVEIINNITVITVFIEKPQKSDIQDLKNYINNELEEPQRVRINLIINAPQED